MSPFRRRREDLSLIISCSAEASALRYKISHLFLRMVATALIVLFSSFALSTLHYFHMWKRTTDYGGLKVEVDNLRKENETFRLAARQLSEKISSLEVTSKKLEILSGLEREGFGGVGGPSPYDKPLLSLDSRGLIQHFKSLERKRISLDTKLRQLQEIYNTQNILLAATPAIMPVRGYPSGGFGYRVDPFSRERVHHPGIDISAPRGNKVVVTADGLVVFARRKLGYGKLVKIEHRFGISTLYGHLDRFTVERGQQVEKGDI
ncbi:M23 family metallopeptidase, partial [Acidobacteria bacterium AH-259-L09]|nr:M23 family metallopeptidase [Acidobacteria bacterium AH-259-L09]